MVTSVPDLRKNARFQFYVIDCRGVENWPRVNRYQVLMGSQEYKLLDDQENDRNNNANGNNEKTNEVNGINIKNTMNETRLTWLEQPCGY